jgi:hypothetical protein
MDEEPSPCLPLEVVAPCGPPATPGSHVKDTSAAGGAEHSGAGPLGETSGAAIVMSAGMARVLFHGLLELPAVLLAAPTGFGTDPAVFVYLGMPVALIAAALADGRAGLQERLDDLGVVLRLAAYDSDGGDADVGAVQAEPYALDHLGDVLLAQVRCGVGGAGLGAVVEGVDGGGQHPGLDVESAE